MNKFYLGSTARKRKAKLEDITPERCAELLHLIATQKFLCYQAAKKLGIPYRFAKVIHINYINSRQNNAILS